MKSELVPANGDPPIPIVRDVTLVGRRDDCDVTIHHSALSKRHCVIVRTDGLLIVRDLATTNGTKVNGQRVRWAALLPNDRLSLAGYKLKIYLGADDVASPSELASARAKHEHDFPTPSEDTKERSPRPKAEPAAATGPAGEDWPSPPSDEVKPFFIKFD
jgi:predicted component of type VI protein secretion system